ncbi:MAG: hypothetical protein ACXVAX_03110 [Pseudobdellovibrio sp.]
MEFEIKDLEIIDAAAKTQTLSETPSQQSHIPNSIILNELHKETEELQAKIKLNHRRLLLFETENNKLMEEKNKLFFETQNYREKYEMLLEKNQELQKINTQVENSNKLLLEKTNSLEDINKTQMTEIRRFSKFHSKIQEVVKPLVVKLKTQVEELKTELTRSQKMNANLNLAYNELKNNAELEIKKRNHEIENLTAEKHGLTYTYEEQIHSFSKEILSLQSLNEEKEQEITRLKKAVEFKNYFENEVIRFKRIHEEDQQKIAELTQKKSAQEAKVISNEQTISEIKTELAQIKNKSSDYEMNLEVTRTQLSKKIDELTQTHERLARLEKLNNQLSLELSLKQN